MKRLNAFLPFNGICGSRALGPVVSGPFQVLVFRVPAEIEDVPLRDTHVFEQHPRRMRQALRNFASILCREVFYHLIKCGVRVPAIE